MQLHADDFGCIPDGRVLDKVAIAAGSSQLDVLAGALRPGDVGKHISIPGAADLTAIIADLVRRKDCTGSINAGSKELEAYLTAQQGFFQHVHEGLRITVAGAGPAGTPL